MSSALGSCQLTSDQVELAGDLEFKDGLEISQWHAGVLGGAFIPSEEKLRKLLALGPGELFTAGAAIERGQQNVILEKRLRVEGDANLQAQFEEGRQIRAGLVQLVEVEKPLRDAKHA